jgi:hypothetical protein
VFTLLQDASTGGGGGTVAAIITAGASLAIAIANGVWFKTAIERKKSALQKQHDEEMVRLQDRLDLTTNAELERIKNGLNLLTNEKMERIKKDLDLLKAKQVVAFKLIAGERLTLARRRGEILDKVATAASGVEEAADNLLSAAHVKDKPDHLMRVAVESFRAMTKYFEIVKLGIPNDKNAFNELQKRIVRFFIALEFEKGGDTQYIQLLSSLCREIKESAAILRSYCEQQKEAAYREVGNVDPDDLEEGMAAQA